MTAADWFLVFLRDLSVGLGEGLQTDEMMLLGVLESCHRFGLDPDDPTLYTIDGFHRRLEDITRHGLMLPN
jgi:hypothetical protein